MKVEKKELQDCIVEIGVQADAAEIEDVCKKTLAAFVRNGVIPGFRKGKAPVQVVKQKFENEIRQETKQACIDKLVPEAVKEAGVEPIAYAYLNDVLMAPETGISFKLGVETEPKVELPKYKKISVSKNETPVSDADVDGRFEEMRRMFAKYEDAKEGDSAADGDFVQIDYCGTADGRKVSEIAPDSKFLAGSEGFWAQMDASRFLPALVDALKGMKKGETKDGIEVKEAPGAPETLAGKTLVYSVTVKDLRKQSLPSDDELAKTVKAESPDALRKSFRERMEREAAEAELERRRNECADLLLKGAKFDVPASRINAYSSAMLNDFAARAQQTNMDPGYIKEHSEDILKDVKKQAADRVRLDCILDGIAKAENITVSDEEIRGKIAADMANGADPKVDASRRFAAYKAAELRMKALDFVIGASK